LSHRYGRCISDAGYADYLVAPAVGLLTRDARIQGWSSGTATDSADAMAFASRHGVRPMIETFPLADASSALQAMSSGTVRFRAVLETSAT